jgi:hypothetical protein
MANPEHVKILKQGVETWNKWRKENPDNSPNLKKADLSLAELKKIDFSGANLNSANLKSTNLTDANLYNADVQKANLYDAELCGADLFLANLEEANLEGADLQFANLSHALLLMTNLRHTNLAGAIFTGTTLAGANLECAEIVETVFSNTDLSQTKGLQNLISLGHSIVDHQTLLQSKNLPEKFLRDCGFPDQFIEYLPSLLNSLEPVQFYSCFISHSAKDEDFARRLHSDLQAQGIRCWYAPENLKIGDEISPTIDKAIRVHEKLLLIFSDNSITSTWVKKEANEAMATEKEKGKKDVLFPIRLDDSIMDTIEQWADDVKRERHIGDFKDWKDHDAYRISFDRLLRDLKRGGS